MTSDSDGSGDGDDGYSEREDVQRMVDQAVERHGKEYVAENIDQLLAGLNVVMNVDKDELDIPSPADTQETDPDTTSRYTNGEGEQMSFAQIALAAAKDPNVTVEETPDGYRIDGTLYTPIDE
jgi:hypothetical protein